MVSTTTQLHIEQDMYTEAKNRLNRDNTKSAQRGAWSESKLGIRYTRSATSVFSKAVSAFMNQPAQVGRRMNRAAEKLRQTGLEPEVIAHLFTKAMFNLLPLSKGKVRIKRVSLCIRTADLIHDEWRIRFFAKEENRKNLLKKLFKQFDKRTYPRHWRKRTIRNYFHAEQIEWSQWSTHDKLHVGYALLILFRDSTGLVETGGRNQWVEPMPALIENFEQTAMKRITDYMIYKPMVVKPLPWTPDHLYRGGYLSNRATIRHYPIVKGAKSRDYDRFERMDWSRILPAVNALQETAWRINRTMLDTLEWAMFDKGGGIAGLPLANAKQLPPEPPGYRFNEEIRKEHDKTCFLIHSENREVISKRLAVLATIAIGKQFRNFSNLFFPHNLDSRGRAYPLPAFLNPQGPDYVKALLEFGEGKPIENDEQAAWLAIAGANAYGQDKISLQDRVNWVQDNDEMIFSIATDPRHDLRWMEASEPFQFLRFCLEWHGFWNTGFGFVSHMVVPVDATCSGLQHYSAMLRDEVGGRSVNLVPGLPRQDIYQDVADRVTEKLFREANAHPVWCRDWIAFGIDRKITKRQVMVVPYAGTFASCMEYTRAAVNEKLKDGHMLPWPSDAEDHNDRIVFLSKLIWEAIDEVVVKGKEAMRWLSKAAGEYTKWANKQDGGPFHKRMDWVTPDGFEAIHYRAEEKKNHVNTFLDGRVQLTYHEATSRLDGKDMALAVAPNFVHSFDAALLRMAVMKGLDKGLTSFGMVHDSFGVHAADMAMFLKECVKPAFLDLYRTNVLAEFEARLPPEVRERLDPIPDMGNLDLNGVLESEFFFS